MSAPVELDFETPATPDFTLRVRWRPAGAALGVFGPSGAGKTTLLESLAGLRRARGRIAVHGRSWLDTERGVRLPPERRGVGWVPQESLLFPHRDVRGNLEAGRHRARPGGPDTARVIEVLELGALLARDVRTLSGGERQRVALGRALGSGPELLLLDEPLAGLDLPLRQRILPYLWRVREEFAVPTLFVSHTAGEVQLLCDEVAVLERGTIVATGHPADVLADPARGAGFENVLRGLVLEVHGATASVSIGAQVLHVPATGVEPGGRVSFGLRAEDVMLAASPPHGLSARNVVAATVAALGTTPETALRVRLALPNETQPLYAAITPEAARALALAVGRPVHAVFKAQSCRILATIPAPLATSNDTRYSEEPKGGDP